MEPEIQFAVWDKEALHTDRIKSLTTIVEQAKQESDLSPEDLLLLQQAMTGWIEDTLKLEDLYDDE